MPDDPLFALHAELHGELPDDRDDRMVATARIFYEESGAQDCDLLDRLREFEQATVDRVIRALFALPVDERTEGNLRGELERQR